VEFESVIGLEIHAQLRTETKIFCGCRATFGGEPNTKGCPVCLGLPGALPVMNREAAAMAVKAGLALGCAIQKRSIFARKNYFYPDLPKGYQISQYDMPICGRGHLIVEAEGARREIGITRIHLEEDAGKLVHDQDVDTLFDVNRCGTPLIEIVTEPDIRSGAEAYAFLVSLKQILQYLDVCDCNMEEASLRCDANISVRPKGDVALGVKTELKNMNSFRGVEKAIGYEIRRQIDVVSSGGKVLQQTFLWDPDKNQTAPMRSKEHAHDYRYFPEPDLAPLIVADDWIERIRQSMPELPQARYERFLGEYGLAAEHAATLIDSRALADYFEQTVKAGAPARQAANWVLSEILRILKELRIETDNLAISPARLAAIIGMVSEGVISARAAKTVLHKVQDENSEPDVVVEREGLKQISDAGALEETIKKILADNPQEAQRLKDGDKKLIAFFVGQTMRATKGKGNPKEINAILAKLLS
jgi:aspartyl-tRNA(Asn)/glutamyl-tRNA(Gln) amidotransferase subunit B